ncbi:cell wall-binding repeat-containing protein [Mesobacillus selenatarsenatis]|uniref:Putative cell wall-binding domain n=1 Tax=Mesobacillus selenatarsenatis (strain DSM 18680 / JCM 14380 / FERM P-15431 / SF-1) TaxID=1321606 RepID=A0A0A8WWN0_MESS1|nr:cell wall-binding repeat-containing protein [Mesobacillus selenatarsenatis]GAM12018.1 putative cell wall-binding domain [Mesobacillus selenatarsenatis SF-1]
MKKISLILLLLPLLFTSYSHNNRFASAEEFLVPDPNLRLTLAGINERNPDITADWMGTLTDLDASWMGVSNIAGLENLLTATELYLSDNFITDLAPISNLNQIEILDLSRNSIQDLRSLGNLKNIQDLRLNQNQINDISPLQSMKFNCNSCNLNLSKNKIQSIFSLMNIEITEINNSFSVDISNNLVNSLNGLESISKLSTLEAANNTIGNLAPLSELTNLRKLNINNNKVSSLSSLAQLDQLTDIEASNNLISSLKGLNLNQEDVHYLNLMNNRIIDINALSNVTAGYIDLSNNKITDIRALRNIQHGSVNLKGNPLFPDALDTIKLLESRGVEVQYDEISYLTFDENRIAGTTRYHTAVEISRSGWSQANTVFIAKGDSFPDALAGVPLAYQMGSPILLTEKEKLTPITKEEIVRLGAKKVVILGGSGAISPQVEQSLKKVVESVERIAGNSRFETAYKISEKLTGNPEKAIIAFAHNFPDALSIASYAAQKGYPILLTEKDSLPFYTKKGLEGKTEALVIGGESVIGKNVFSELNRYNPVRIGGNNRFDTAAKIVSKLKLNTENVYVANGFGFADALTGSVLAAKQGSPLLLVGPDKVPAETGKTFETYPINNFTVFGGSAVVNDSVIYNLNEYLK